MTEKHFWYWLCNIPGIGNKSIQKLLDIYDEPKYVYYASKEELKKIKGISEQMIYAICLSRKEEEIQEKYDILKKKGIYFLCQEDSIFPETLKHIYNPPFGLYYKGKFPDYRKITIAIVGARTCSNYGKEVALSFGKELSKNGIQIISGLARGIDSYSHIGALETENGTFGVLGCGIDICYPAENIELYINMQKNGGIISEYAPGVYGRPGFFPMRNRLISGMSDGILVVEAREKSGSLITANLGLEQGKMIFAIPGRIEDDLSKGCNQLIKMGAELVESPEDILQNFHLKISEKNFQMKKNNNLLEKREKIVYACLSLIPKHINVIKEESHIEMVDIIDILISLEIKGYTKQITKNYYVVK